MLKFPMMIVLLSTSPFMTVSIFGLFVEVFLCWVHLYLQLLCLLLGLIPDHYVVSFFVSCNSLYFKVIFFDLNIIHDTIILLQESMGRIFSDINHNNVFLGQSPKAIEVKPKINRWDVNIITISPTKSTFSCMPRRIENIHTHKNLYMSNHGIINHKTTK